MKNRQGPGREARDEAVAVLKRRTLCSSGWGRPPLFPYEVGLWQADGVLKKFLVEVSMGLSPGGQAAGSLCPELAFPNRTVPSRPTHPPPWYQLTP